MSGPFIRVCVDERKSPEVLELVAHALATLGHPCTVLPEDHGTGLRLYPTDGTRAAAEALREALEALWAEGLLELHNDVVGVRR